VNLVQRQNAAMQVMAKRIDTMAITLQQVEGRER